MSRGSSVMTLSSVLKGSYLWDPLCLSLCRCSLFAAAPRIPGVALERGVDQGDDESVKFGKRAGTISLADLNPLAELSVDDRADIALALAPAPGVS